MKNPPGFLREFLTPAKALLKANPEMEPFFSQGTYQIEIQDEKKTFFPLLQLKEDGEVTDSFCSCAVSEAGKGCPHLAACYLYIFNQKSEPLHVRFQKSFWSHLFQMEANLQGFSLSSIKKGKEGYTSLPPKPFFSLSAKKEMKRKMDLIFSEKPPETEETSLKFFNLPLEELQKYKEGRPSFQLQFELSFWSDLAKAILLLAEREKYQIFFKPDSFPEEITIRFTDLEIKCQIPKDSWPEILPSLASVKSPLEIMDQNEEILESVVYDEISHTLILEYKREEEIPFTGIPVGEWIYVEKKGFYRKKKDPLFEHNRIEEKEIGPTLSRSWKALKSFLKIDPEEKQCHYYLYFDPAGNLHIALYVLNPGDLQTERSYCFPPWVYVADQGFFLLEEWLFEGKEKIILKHEVADFINKHRVWLHQFPGFQTHLGSIESHLVYRVNEEKALVFDAELNFPQEYEEVLNFDEWVFIKGQGFYMKKESRGRLPIHPGLSVPKEDISTFISHHREELEQVQGFFNDQRVLKEIGLSLELDETGKIIIEPKREFASHIDPEKVSVFGNFLYLDGKGFSEIPLISRLPERYQERVEIPSNQEAAFIAYELDPLRPYLLSVDPRLQKPEYLKLKIHKIVKDRKRRSQEWLVQLDYESEIGSLNIFDLWDAIQEKKRHLFSRAGLLFLKDLRFNWLRQLPLKKLDRKRNVIRLNTLEWIRLTVFEEFLEPKGNDPEAIATRETLEELSRLETHRLLDVSKLKATLRPYQETGLHWLWFLYCHGLSGLLCDDMGLGKTHQAMALLASVSHEDRDQKNKYLVVCPTSVIYHWQELLKRFLPEMRVCIYHGLGRSQEDLAEFETRFDILVTSYGILRTGRENLKPIFFEVAIFDEIQVAKNHISQTHLALRDIRATMRLGLSGTPIENRIRELKSLIDLVLPGYLPSDSAFRELFIHPIEKGDDPEKKVLLGRLVKPFILRRKKSEVLRDLPEKIEEIAYCDLSEQQQKIYREIALQTRDTVYKDLKDSSKPAPYVHIFSILSRLKQVCDHPCLIEGNPKEYAAHHSGKFELFMELLNEAMGSGQKVVVFSQFLDMIAIIEAYLKKKGIGYASIKGSTRDRSEQLRKFRDDPQCSVFVASLLAAGVGIDLTVASIVIHYDRWWNPAKENQATDRVHRIGQNRGVQVFKLVTKNTIEEHIHEMIERKKGLLEDIIGEEDQINYLNRDELVEVFEKLFKEVE